MYLSKEKLRHIGLILAIAGSVISGIGVIANNILLDHILAMQVWRFSNVILAIYFFGNWKRWWEGGLSSGIMCGLYTLFLLTNEWGLQNG